MASLQAARDRHREAYRIAMAASSWEETRDALLKLIDAVDWMIEAVAESPTTPPGATTMTENYSKSQQKRMAIQRGEATTMTPMNEERLAEIDDDMRQRGYVDNDAAAELLAEVHRLRTLPPEVAAAMERYAKHINALVSGFTANSPYWLGLRADGLHWDLGAVSSDQDTIAQHFTVLFQKCNQP